MDITLIIYILLLNTGFSPILGPKQRSYELIIAYNLSLYGNK